VDAHTHYRRYRLRLEGHVVCVKVHMTRVVDNGGLLSSVLSRRGGEAFIKRERSRQRVRKTATSQAMACEREASTDMSDVTGTYHSGSGCSYSR
jgi:hypothetical protein